MQYVADFNKRKMTATLHGVENVPVKWVICGYCGGDGAHSRNLGSFTASEWNEQDEDFKEDYMNGAYDIPCIYCEGGKSVDVDESRATEEQIKEVQEGVDFERECAAERKAEHRMCGGDLDWDGRYY